MTFEQSLSSREERRADPELGGRESAPANLRRTLSAFHVGRAGQVGHGAPVEAFGGGATLLHCLQRLRETSPLRAQLTPRELGYHPGVTCDRTGMSPILGDRYKLDGENYDGRELRPLSSAAGAAPSGTATPQLLELPASCTAVAAGRSHGLALCGGGDATVYSWGVGDYGQLGAGAAEERPHAERLPLPLGVAPRCVAAGGYGSAVLVGRAAGELGPPQPPALSAGSALSLADGRRWGELAERATYVTLMRTYEAAPPVVAALRASIPRLLSHLGGEIEAAQGAQTALLQNPLLSHSSEEANALTLAGRLASLSPPASRRAAELLSAAPNEVLGGRVVRPLRELLERLFCRGGSLAALTERVCNTGSQGSVILRSRTINK
ncbi:hypothetical protein EMIHUDRAFT_453595 [Emiliania huxleyi CCMP1516]|uniref:Uncharacterized protein n=2 Tax=Emiliania huxleyi TaxID=2903 RepID=A0A0D3I397_EMIH1|nr:hypothetical protein EMIHUDRAFT_453595 [Emiliania huxleyi CCMP1516]EOD05732.1 hypothetical protein EMIHUDRAFT_453595 [Emiliania huxleyi CCMP1516]|eukprot:XP_005758161.1 hypothetical protein EMIHUDRAFT_453595 [Emiliania huxleyi CCMP1516]